MSLPQEVLTCRTMGANLHITRAEAHALLAHMQEPNGGVVIRRRLEVLLGEKTLGQVDDEAEQERTRRKVEPLGSLSAEARAVIAGCVADSEDVTQEPEALAEVWAEVRRAFPLSLAEHAK